MARPHLLTTVCMLVAALVGCGGLGFAYEFTSTDAPKAIPDLTTITSTITVTETDCVTDVDVVVNISHTWDEDLDVFLIDPFGTRVELFTDVGGGGNNFTDTILDDEATTSITAVGPPYSGRFRPEGCLNACNGGAMAGTWTLEITDDSMSDIGVLNSWAIIVMGMPTVEWAGTNGFVADGVAPDSGVQGMQFTYKVKCIGGAADAVRVRLFSSGSEVACSPLTMTLVSGTPETGQIYMVKKTLSSTLPYSYRFEVQCGGIFATGPPTQSTFPGPAVLPPPVLSWAGTNGFVDDGVAPNGGVPGTQFTWKVKCTGAAPDAVYLHLYYNGTEVAASPLTMTPISGTPATGQIFMVKKTLSGTSPYAYFFSARIGTTWATGVPVAPRAGPFVFAPPTLSWAGTNGFVTDGVAPDSAPAGMTFTYKVKYTGPTPDFVRLRLYYNGAEVGASPLEMSVLSGTSTTGQIFGVKRNLGGVLAYSYRFEARCMGVWATGPPAQLTAGPVATASSPSQVAMVGGLTCNTASGGVRAVFTLSAEAAVTAEVLNIAGRPVRTVVTDRQMPAGMNELYWDGRNNWGLAVPSGTYLIRLTARTGGGAQAQAVTTLRIAR